MTVTKSGTGTGTVTAATGIDCGATCVASYAANAVVMLTASATTALAAESNFRGWTGGGCTGLSPTCSVTMSQARTVNALFTLAPNAVFVTQSAYAANFGGATQADTVCQNAAIAGSRTGTFKALVSTSSSPANVRFGSASGWARIDGRPYANSLAEVGVGKVFNPVRLSELGNDLGNVRVWTGSGYSGNWAGATNDCLGWTSTSAADHALSGESGAGGTMSVSFSWHNCDQMAHLLCFQVDRAAATNPPVTPASKRMAFVSNMTFNTTGGLAAADAICNAEAVASSLQGSSTPGSYAALLADVGASAGSRFDVNGPEWVRTDGVVVHQDVANMFTATLWDSTLNLAADGTTYYANNDVWSGASNPGQVGFTSTTCNGWSTSSNSSTGTAGRMGYSVVQQLFSADYTSACGQGFHLMCLQK